jgi:hypothetical protein
MSRVFNAVMRVISSLIGVLINRYLLQSIHPLLDIL